MLFALGCAHNQVSSADGRITLAPGLSSDIQVTGIRCVKNKDGYCMFRANVLNSAKKQARLEYKVQWLDGAGMEIESVVSTWQMIAVQPKEVRELSAVAASKDAADFRFYLRPFGR